MSCVTTSWLHALLLGLLLGQPDARELGLGEDRRRQHGVVGSRPVEAEHVVDRDPRLVLGDRRELVAPGDVAGGPDALDGGAHVLVDDDAEPVVLDPELVEVQRLDVRHAARREQDALDAKLTRSLSLHRDDRRDHVVAVATDALHVRGEHDLDAVVLLEHLLEHRGGLRVRARREPVGALDDGHTRAEAREDLRELQADGPAADDEQGLRQLGQLEGRDVVDPVDLADALDRRDGGPRSGRDQDPVRRQLLVADAHRVRVD